MVTNDEIYASCFLDAEQMATCRVLRNHSERFGETISMLILARVVLETCAVELSSAIARNLDLTRAKRRLERAGVFVTHELIRTTTIVPGLLQALQALGQDLQ